MTYPQNGDILYPMGAQDRLQNNPNLSAYKEYIISDCSTATGWAASSGTITAYTTTNEWWGRGAVLNIAAASTTDTLTFTPSSHIDLSPISGTTSDIAKAGAIVVDIDVSVAVTAGTWQVILTDGAGVTYTVWYNLGCTSASYMPYGANNSPCKMFFDLTMATEVSAGSFNWTDVATVAVKVVNGATNVGFFMHRLLAVPTLGYGHTVIDPCDATTGWSTSTGSLATSTATTKPTQTYLVSTSAASQNDMVVSKTVTAIDLSAEMGASTGRPTVQGPLFFVYVKPSHSTTATTSYVEFRVGSDSSNYYYVRYYHGFLSNAAGTGRWHKIVLDPYNATITGTPNNASLTYVAVREKHSANVTLVLNFDEIYYGEPTLYTANINQGYLYYKNDRYKVTSGYLAANDMEGRYIIATLDSGAGTATLSSIAYGTALTTAQVLVGYVNRGRLYDHHGGEIKEEVLYQEWSSVYQTSTDLTSMYIPFTLYRDYVDIYLTTQSAATVTQILTLNPTTYLGTLYTKGDATTNGTTNGTIRIYKNLYNISGNHTFAALTSYVTALKISGY